MHFLPPTTNHQHLSGVFSVNHAGILHLMLHFMQDFDQLLYVTVNINSPTSKCSHNYVKSCTQKYFQGLIFWPWPTNITFKDNVKHLLPYPHFVSTNFFNQTIFIAFNIKMLTRHVCLYLIVCYHKKTINSTLTRSHAPTLKWYQKSES